MKLENVLATSVSGDRLKLCSEALEALPDNTIEGNLKLIEINCQCECVDLKVLYDNEDPVKFNIPAGSQEISTINVNNKGNILRFNYKGYNYSLIRPYSR